jgi:KDO2-lipid IV(A) lauroyltransferase
MAIYNSTNLFFIELFTRVVPRRIFPPLAFLTAFLLYLLLRKQRSGFRLNLRVVTGRHWVEPLVVSGFYKYARNWCDIMLMSRLSGARLRSLIGGTSSSAPIDDALASGTGAILISPHLGNWELGGLGLADIGYPINVMTFREPDESFNRSREQLRSERGIRFIYVDRDDASPLAIIEAVNALRRNEVLCLLGDRDGSSNTTEMNFFNRKTRIPVGAAHLALVSGAPVIPAFVVLENGLYTTIMEQPVYFKPQHGHNSESVRDGMAKVISIFEHYIGKYPDQWYNFFPFWEEDTSVTGVTNSLS